MYLSCTCTCSYLYWIILQKIITIKIIQKFTVLEVIYSEEAVTKTA